MNAQSLIGKKIDQTQGFLEDGTRVPLSIISVAGNVVSQVKTADNEGYSALQIGFGIAKKSDKPTTGHLKKAGLKETPRFFREIRVDDVTGINPGTNITVAEVFEPGDLVDVVGTSKGKGYAGVVKRHGFHGGPKTHGQSDRHRAPGASGQGTTPGRVYRGKRMSGRMGNERVTVKNLEVLDVKEDIILVKGLIPGSKGAVVVVSKVGKNKKFMPLWSEKKIEEAPVVETPEETVKEASQTVETPEETVKVESISEEEIEKNLGAGPEVVSEEASAASDTVPNEQKEVKENAGK
jgi:large subunit ribosomal protein L3